jgi:transketolase N-terminal domain/subunit
VVSFTPVNDLNIRVYVDNLFLRSTGHREQAVYGFLVSYNFLPKSWVYLAINEAQDRSDEIDGAGNILPRRLHTTARAAVLKAKYLYYL